MMATIDPKDLVIWLDKKWGNRGCPLCGVKDWRIDMETYVLLLVEGTTLDMNTTLPVLTITCGNCYRIELVNPNLVAHELANAHRPSSKR